jgi:hypothetical protein
MENQEIEPRWFLIDHKCGGILTMDACSMVESLNTDHTDQKFRCPGCFETVNDVAIKELRGFCKDYIRVIRIFKQQGFSIREASPEEPV